MRIFTSLPLVLFIIISGSVCAQTTYLPEGNKVYQFIDRLEIKQGKFTDLNYSTIKPYSREAVVAEAEYIDSASQRESSSIGIQKKWNALNLSRTDQYNLNRILMNNKEWVSDGAQNFESKRPILNTFYVTPPNLYEVDTEDFFLAVNPVLNFQIGKESSNDDALYYNKRGITARGRIANKIGFSTTLTDNQERGPSFFKPRVDSFRAVPGVGFYKRFKTNGYDYFDARGYITFGVTKYIDVQFGFDKNFIGNGYRSLFLSDFGNSYLFLKLNTRIWKFNYENIFMELMPQFTKTGDDLLDRKYATMHHLSMNVTKWLNVGVFEGVVFGRRNRFDFQYLNPIIFLRHIEGTVGSPDNAVAGLDFKAQAANHFQFYGQFLLDEFLLKEVSKGDGYWANKYGYQLGVKYVDAFNLSNLDLQFETNRVRPFTYSHFNEVGNYTHYNQPLAHPLGGAFQEVIGVLKYQPAPKWYINARAIYYTQGLDTAGLNFGSNPFKLYTTRSSNYGYQIGTGNKIQVANLALTLSYELKENLFLEGNALYRKQSGEKDVSLFTLGVRWNTFRRDYDY